MSTYEIDGWSLSKYRHITPYSEEPWGRTVLANTDVDLPDLRRLHTIPFRNSSSAYFVPRQTIPSFQSVRNIERSSV